METTPLTSRRGSSDYEDDGKKKRNIIIVSVIIFLIIAVVIAIVLAVVLKKKHDEATLRQRLNKIGDNLVTVSGGITNFWDEKGLDAQYGGFYGTLDREGVQKQPDSKSLLQTSQHLWSYATLAALQNSTKRWANMNNLYNFLGNFYSFGIDSGQYYSMVARNGTVLDWTYKIYPEAYTILGLTKYYEVTKNHDTIELFNELFDDIDDYHHDPVYGGYNITYDPTGKLYPTTTKDAAAHLALVQALTATLDSDQEREDELPRLRELINLFTYTFIRPETYTHQTFSYEWAPTGSNNENYGLDLEVVFALQKAAQAVGWDNITNVVKALGAKASEKGFDSTDGGYFFEGNSAGQPVNKDKVYSTQASSLLGNWEMYLITKENVYLDRMEKTIDWINNKQADSQYKEWYENIDSHGTIPNTDKGTELKSSFHPIRATVWLADEIHTYADK